MNIALARPELEGLQRTACTMINGAMRTTPTKVLEMLSDLTTFRTVVEFTALMAAYRIPRPDLRNLGKGHNWIWTKADKVDSKFSMIKNQVTQRRNFGKYRIMILTRQEWGRGETGPIN